MMKRRIATWWHALIDMLLPPRCFRCGHPTSTQGSLCANCWKQVHFITKPYCAICSHPFPYDVGDEAICGTCIAKKPLYDRTICVMIYDDYSRNLMTRFKYSDKTYMAPQYRQYLSQYLSDIITEIDFICPVPLHRLRMLKRKYNQAALLAEALAKHHNISYKPDILHRTKNTKPQASLSRKERLTNIKNCFAMSSKFDSLIKGKHVLLVDDVMTTGATLEECARILKKHGAARVTVATLARTLHSEDV